MNSCKKTDTKEYHFFSFSNVNCSLNIGLVSYLRYMFHMHAWLKMGGIRGHQERKGDASNLVVLVWLRPKDFVSFGKLVGIYIPV